MEKEKGSPDVANFLSVRAKIAGSVILQLVRRLRVKVEGAFQLDEAKNNLLSGSVIIPFNHIALPDPLIIYRVLTEYLGDDLKEIDMPASIKFFDGRKSYTTID